MKFLTREEVAKYFRVHARTVERWLKSGSLKGYKLGKGKTALWRIPEEAVNKFLATNSNQKKK
jgi:excisionase family DNA binding protein